MPPQSNRSHAEQCPQENSYRSSRYQPLFLPFSPRCQFPPWKNAFREQAGPRNVWNHPCWNWPTEWQTVPLGKLQSICPSEGVQLKTPCTQSCPRKPLLKAPFSSTAARSQPVVYGITRGDSQSKASRVTVNKSFPSKETALYYYTHSFQVCVKAGQGRREKSKPYRT